MSEETVSLARHKVILGELARLRSEVERLEAELKTTRELHTALWRAVDAHVRAREKGLNVLEPWRWHDLAGAWVAYPPAPLWTCPGCDRTALSGIDTACPGCGREVPAFETALGGNPTEDAAATTQAAKRRNNG
jgi:rubrerythrin